MSNVSAPLNNAESLAGRTAPESAAQVAVHADAARAPWYSRPLQLIVVCGIILIAVVMAVTWSLLSNLRDRDLTDREHDLSSLSLVLAEQLDRSFQSIDLIQTVLVERMQNFGISSIADLEQHMSGYDTYQRFNDLIGGLPHIDAIILTDANGKLINFSRTWPIPDINSLDQDHTEAFRSDPYLMTLVSKPRHSQATGNWVLPIARKVIGPNGKFLGVILGVMELRYFENLFQSIMPGEGSSISLHLNDGTILARYPRIESVIGRSFPASLNALGMRDRGTIRIRQGTMDGKDRILAAQRLAHFPLYVTVGDDISTALASWKRGAMTMIGAALIIGLVIGGVVVLCVWRVGKNLREHDLQRDVALNHMSQGLCMFDAKQRLIVCNERYADLYGLSKEQTKPGTTLRAILEYRIAAGNAPEDHEKYIADRLDEVGKNQPYQVTNRLDNGRYISVVHTPMADGGWVATHEDVTEARYREGSFRLLFERNPVPMWVFDRETLRFLAVNDAAVAHYGYSREQLMAMSVLDVRPAEDRAKFIQHQQALPDDQINPNIVQHLRSDGSKIDVSIYSRTLMYSGHKARMVALHDITKIKLTESELRRTKKFLDTIIEHVPLPIVVKNVPNSSQDALDCQFTLVNRAFEELTGDLRSKLIGKSASELYTRERAERIAESDRETLESRAAVLTLEHPIVTASNGIRLVAAKKVAIRDDDGKPQYLLSLLDDVTERRRSEQRIAHMAHYDSLTELPNRAAFNERFAATLERAAANNEQFSVLSVDFDHFKEVNDLFGHSTGDALLREATRRLQAAATGAFLARVGGDEFMLIVTHGTQPAAAAALSERLLAAFVDEFEVDGRQLQIGLTIGGAVYPRDGTDAKTLMVNADTALYRAKADMRGSILFFEPSMSIRLGERLALQGALRTAIARGELLLHYQPQVRMSGETIGFEALLRWQHPSHGMVSPATFIPIAEESGLIVAIGEWVLREACREAASWPHPLTVAVNISPIQFHQGDLPSLVHSILLETGLAATRLELEVTENVLIDDFPRAVSILRRLKALGVQIALDDFGTGYSSLSYLHSFAFDRIKIDRAFIGDLDHNRHSMVIVRAVIGLGHSLDVPILAEGVETEIQHAILVQEGCDAMQGYLTGRPQPIANYAKLIGAETAAREDYAQVG
ncbi:MAG: EAL domain-containing protein [Rhizobiales bacterium]|nr:EAL domain-containing protein [Hyphomicrobiales bacterium]